MLLRFAYRTIKIQALSLVLCLFSVLNLFVLFMMAYGGLYAATGPNIPDAQTGSFAGIPLTLIGISLLPLSLIGLILVVGLFGYSWKRLWKDMNMPEMMMHICLLLGNLGLVIGGSR